MTKLHGWKKVCAAFLLCAATAITGVAQDTLTTLVSFDRSNGAYPVFMTLVQGTDGNFYGTTYSGGGGQDTCISGCGTVFKMTPAGTLSKLHNFCSLANCADGYLPQASLIQATNGKFYGTTTTGGAGGPGGCGTVFEITAAGVLTTLHSFAGTDGCAPYAGLVQASNGNFYGTTAAGGSNSGGTVFEMTSDGVLTTLYTFCSLTNCADGSYPRSSLVQAANGNLYGVTAEGGASVNNDYCASSGCGTVFGITLGGVLKTLYSFCSLPACGDGAIPIASLIQAADGTFYGTTSEGGKHADCTEGCGVLFKMTPYGKLTTIHNFCSLANCADGSSPFVPLAQATDGNLYGTTPYNGSYSVFNVGNGTAFEITPAGAVTVLHSFCSLSGCADGQFPYGALLQATNGSFYGTTYEGGADNYGTAFSLSTGLDPFVAFLHGSAKIGQPFGILGQGLGGTTKVSLNGVSAKFTIEQDTFLVATVPRGAKTGYVTVTTPSGTLTSNVPFQVLP